MNDPQNFGNPQWQVTEAEITAAQRLVAWVTELGQALDGWRQEQVLDLDPQVNLELHPDDFDEYTEPEDLELDFEDFDEPEPERAVERHMRWDVYVNSNIIYSAATYEDAAIVSERIREGNRWAVAQHNSTYIYQTEGEPSLVSIDDLEIPWLASITRGQAGWNVYPKPHAIRFTEGIYSYQKDTDGRWTEKQVNVIAASALEAIERAKFLLCAGGKNA